MCLASFTTWSVMKNRLIFYTIFFVVAAALVAALFATGIQSSTGGKGERPRTGSIKWSPCPDGWATPPDSPGIVCGTLSVPTQRSTNRQSGDVVKLAIAKLPATGKKLGSLILVSGGPGFPGLSIPLARSDAVKKLRENFDIVRYDPRGVGRSEPMIVCSTDEKVISDSRAWMRSCLAMTRKSFMANLSTLDAVDDLDDLRSALGDRKITLVAYSYGTMVAQLYAGRYPRNVRAMVLDGVVDLSENASTTVVNQYRGFNLAFNRFAQYCATVAGCPLPASAAGALEAYRSILSKAASGEIRGPNNARLSPREIHDATLFALYSDETWSALAGVLIELNTLSVGNEALQMLKTASLLSQGDEMKAAAIISCADNGPGTGTPSRDVLENTFSTALKNDAEPLGPADCSGWPYAARVTASMPIRDASLPQLLFVSQTGDPTTPYGSAVKMSAAFESPLITREGIGHTFVLSAGFACADEKVVRYLVEPGKAVNDAYCSA